MAEESFEKTVARVVEAVDTCGGPVMVVGHSGGGLLAAAAAEARPDEVRTVVYVAGFMLPSGVLYSDVLSQFLAEMPNEAARLTGIGSHLVFTPERDATSAPVESAMKVFFHDCPPAEARAVAERLRVYPESVRAAAPVLTPKRFGRARRVYIECTDDRAILLAMQRRLQDMSPARAASRLTVGMRPSWPPPTS